MGCFLGCFGGEKVQKRRKQRVNRPSPQRQRNRIQNVQQEKVVTAEQLVTENHQTNLVSEVSELGNKPEVVEQRSSSPSPSPRKRVTFNSNVTTYEHVPIHKSIESLPDSAANEEEKEEGLKSSSHSQSKSKDDDSITSSVGSYPPNHRYHNARESGDEAEEEEYGDSDLDDEDEYEDEDYYSDDEEDNVRLLGHEVWSESVITASMESRTGNSSPPQEVESLMVKKTHTTNARDRSDYINSVLNPVENITQWKAAKAKGGKPLLKPQKENFATSEAPSKAKKYQEIAVDASLSNWLPSPKDNSTSESCASARSFEDRPILGALTVEEVRQISATPSPRKSPCRSPDDMPIIGSVGSFWNDSGSAKNSGSNTTSKYRVMGW